MGRRWVTATLLPLCACGAQLGDNGTDASRSPDAKQMQMIDARIDSPAPLGAWGTPQKVTGADTTLDEDDVTLSANELELYFKKSNGSDIDLFVMTRTTPTAQFGAPVPIAILNSTANEESPRLADNDLTMYFGRGGDIYKATRASVSTQNWSAASPVGVFNTANNEKWAAVCNNGYAIVSRANGTNSQDLYEGDVTTGANTLITQLNTSNAEQGTFLTTDCLTVYFQSNRTVITGTTTLQFDIYMSTRQTMTSQWSNPTVLPDFNSNANGEEDAWISPGQRTFAFASNAGGNKDVYISTR